MTNINTLTINNILKNLKKQYPNIKTQLNHRNCFQLLIATILSAQCTDKQVNKVTANLFNKYKTAKDFASAKLESIEKIIFSTGFYKNKAKNIKNCCIMLEKKFKANVPKTLDELVKLPGVGRKTANVVLGSCFNIPGMVVDTHVIRISNRLGLTNSKNPIKIEFDLMEIIPKNEWNNFSLYLIYFGREICSAKKPKCKNCFLSDYCIKPKISAQKPITT